MSRWKKCVLLLALLSAVFVVAVRREKSVAAMGEVQHPYVAITFDDGPRRETTTLLLDGLARRGVHATFFVVGTRLEGSENIVRRMAEEGHQVGVHSQNHKVLSDLNVSDLCEEVEVLACTLEGLLGEEELMLRPPYGFVSETLCRWTRSPIILWSVDPEDWADHDVERQVAQVLSEVKDGDIILLHDIYYASVETALRVVDALLAQGYRFVTVEELFALRGLTPEAGREYRSLPPAE